MEISGTQEVVEKSGERREEILGYRKAHCFTRKRF